MEELKRKDGELFSMQESFDFLVTEYEQSFKHLVHYDSIQNTVMTFSFTGYIAVFTTAFAFYQYNSQGWMKFLFISIIFFLSGIVGVVILSVFTRNRLYYTVIAKQVNSLRNYFLSNSKLDFIKFNKAYLNPNRPLNFNPISTYSMYMYLICIFNSTLLGLGILVFTHFIMGKNYIFSISTSIIIGLVILVLELVIAINYLKKKDIPNADVAVWGKQRSV